MLQPYLPAAVLGPALGNEDRSDHDELQQSELRVIGKAECLPWWGQPALRGDLDECAAAVGEAVVRADVLRAW